MNGGAQVVQILNTLDLATLLQLVVTVLVAGILIALIERVMPWLSDRVPSRHRMSVLASVPILRLLLIVVAIAVILPLVVRPTFENLVAILGVLGVALGFAFKDYVSSLIGGIVTLFERPYRPGDWIEINGTYGVVQAIGIRALQMVTPDDTVVSIPHLRLWDTAMFNANDGKRDLLCVTDFYLHPDHDAALARQKLHDVALTSPFLGLDRPVAVTVSEEPWGTHYRIKAYPIDARDQFQFTSDLTVRGKDALSAEGIQFAIAPPAVVQ